MHACIGEGNGDPLQCSCLENPRDGGAWWAAVYGAAQSRTRLKRLSSSSSSNQAASSGKESACNAGDLGLNTRSGGSPGEGKGSPLQYSALENSMDCMVRGVSKSRTRLSHFHFTSHKHNVHQCFSSRAVLLLLEPTVKQKSRNGVTLCINDFSHFRNKINCSTPRTDLDASQKCLESQRAGNISKMLT